MRLPHGLELAHDDLVVTGLVVHLAGQGAEDLGLGRVGQPGADEVGGLELVPGLELQPLGQLGGGQGLVGAEAGLVGREPGAGLGQLGEEALVERLGVHRPVDGRARPTR